MKPENSCAAPDWQSQGGAVVEKAVGASHYHLTENFATNYAVAKVAARFRLRVETARLVCRLSGLGGIA